MTVKSMNPNVEVEYFAEKFTEDNIDSFVGDSDYIFDCVDSFKY
ncbi:MAG: ThiF family adenylyltransferase, partial [Lachnospiraceae bacterium]|nr:ThiF family adenylyltransferase [Lachnospiraceae bacterium]